MLSGGSGKNCLYPTESTEIKNGFWKDRFFNMKHLRGRIDQHCFCIRASSISLHRCSLCIIAENWFTSRNRFCFCPKSSRILIPQNGAAQRGDRYATHTAPVITDWIIKRCARWMDGWIDGAKNAGAKSCPNWRRFNHLPDCRNQPNADTRTLLRNHRYMISIAINQNENTREPTSTDMHTQIRNLRPNHLSSRPPSKSLMNFPLISCLRFRWRKSCCFSNLNFIIIAIRLSGSS